MPQNSPYYNTPNTGYTPLPEGQYSLQDMEFIFNQMPGNSQELMNYWRTNAGPGPWTVDQMRQIAPPDSPMFDGVFNFIDQSSGLSQDEVDSFVYEQENVPQTPQIPTEADYRREIGPNEQALTDYWGQGAGQGRNAMSNVERQLGAQGMKLLGPGGASAGEQALGRYQQDPFLTSLAAGEIPAAIMRQYQDQQDLAQAQIRESQGTAGARFGSGTGVFQQREADRGLNALAAGAQQRAMGAQQLRGGFANQQGGLANQRRGIGGQMLGQAGSMENQARNRWTQTGAGLADAENSRNQAAMQRMFQDYMSQRGLPPEYAALQELMNLGGQTATVKSKSGGGMFCYIAAELYKGDVEKFGDAFRWVNFHWSGPDSDEFRDLYGKYGIEIANKIKTDKPYRAKVKKIFDFFVSEEKEYKQCHKH